MLPAHNRYGYSSIESRVPFRWPNGAGLAVYFGVGVEHYAFNEGMTEDIVPGIPKPDVLNTSWREYGNRVGAWRLMDVFREYRFPMTILLNTEVYEYCPELTDAFRKEGYEIAAHGRTNSEKQSDLDEVEEAAHIRLVTDSISRHEHAPPQGWVSPWIAETAITPDLLQEAGYRYVLDWCMDDQPVWMKTRKGRILSIPCSQEINDSSAVIGRYADAVSFADMIIDQVDEMLVSSRKQAVVLSVILHTNVIGQPFRLRQLRRALAHIKAQGERVWVARAGDIADVIYANPEFAVGATWPGSDVPLADALQEDRL